MRDLGLKGLEEQTSTSTPKYFFNIITLDALSIQTMFANEKRFPTRCRYTIGYTSRLCLFSILVCTGIVLVLVHVLVLVLVPALVLELVLVHVTVICMSCLYL